MDFLMWGSLNKQSLRKPCLLWEQMPHKTSSCSDGPAAGPSLLRFAANPVCNSFRNRSGESSPSCASLASLLAAREAWVLQSTMIPWRPLKYLAVPLGRTWGSLQQGFLSSCRCRQRYLDVGDGKVCLRGPNGPRWIMICLKRVVGGGMYPLFYIHG